MIVQALNLAQLLRLRATFDTYIVSILFTDVKPDELKFTYVRACYRTDQSANVNNTMNQSELEAEIT